MNKRELLHSIQWLQDARVADYLNGGGDPNVKLQGYSLLIQAVRSGLDKQTVRLLLEKGANVKDNDNKEKVTALHEALFKGHADLARVLVEFGADVNATDAVGMTPLMRDATSGWATEIAEWLLSLGADPTKRNVLGGTACTVARLYGHPQYAEFLDARIKEANG